MRWMLLSRDRSDPTELNLNLTLYFLGGDKHGVHRPGKTLWLLEVHRGLSHDSPHRGTVVDLGVRPRNAKAVFLVKYKVVLAIYRAGYFVGRLSAYGSMIKKVSTKLKG